jgi:hypothetical protein
MRENGVGKGCTMLKTETNTPSVEKNVLTAARKLLKKRNLYVTTENLTA